MIDINNFSSSNLILFISDFNDGYHSFKIISFFDFVKLFYSGFLLVLLYKEEWTSEKMVGDEGFEPPHGGVKVLCLTAWRIPITGLSLRIV